MFEEAAHAYFEFDGSNEKKIFFAKAEVDNLKDILSEISVCIFSGCVYLC